MLSSRLGDEGLEGLDPLPHPAASAIAASTWTTSAEAPAGSGGPMAAPSRSARGREALVADGRHSSERG